jgi:hypothetical protein
MNNFRAEVKVKREEKSMSNQDYTATFSVEQTPKEVFDAINNPRGWWSEEIEGTTDEVDSVFNYQYEDVHRCRIKVTELTPGKEGHLVSSGQLLQLHRR